MKTEIEVDGAAYELVPTISRDSVGITLVVSVRRGHDGIAQLRFRCAIDEPTYAQAVSLRIEEMLDLVLGRGTMPSRVRSAINWQSEVEKIKPGTVSPLLFALFPENYEHVHRQGVR